MKEEMNKKLNELMESYPLNYLASRDIRVARLAETVQNMMKEEAKEMLKRHFEKQGYPRDLWRNFEINLPAMSDWREIVKNG